MTADTRVRTAHGLWARWGWLLTTLLLGFATIASAWSNYSTTRGAADELIRAQAEVFRGAVLASVAGGPNRPPTALDSLLAAEESSGLRYAAMVRPDGSIELSAGEPNALAIAPPDTTGEVRIIQLGNRVRAYLPPNGGRGGPGGGGRGGRGGPGGGGPGGGGAGNPGGAGAQSGGQPQVNRIPQPQGGQPGGFDRGPGGRPTTVVVEFEPAIVALVSRALRLLVISGLVSALLMVASLGFWRVSSQRETAERQLAEQRHLSHLGEMSAVLAHEIRNPLASLKGHAQLLLERMAEGTPDHRKAKRVVDETTRLETLTTDLLDFARSGPMDVKPVDPAAVLSAAAADASDKIIVDAAGAPEKWSLDERRMRQGVLGNLLRNAVQASPEGRPPVARVAVEKNALVYTIRDYGAGLPEGTAERIFDPFFTTRTNGTGLGLSVAKRIVEQHGGRISAANAPDGGAMFRIEIPKGRG